MADGTRKPRFCHASQSRHYRRRTGAACVLERRHWAVAGRRAYAASELTVHPAWYHADERAAGGDRDRIRTGERRRLVERWAASMRCEASSALSRRFSSFTPCRRRALILPPIPFAFSRDLRAARRGLSTCEILVSVRLSRDLLVTHTIAEATRLQCPVTGTRSVRRPNGFVLTAQYKAISAENPTGCINLRFRNEELARTHLTLVQ
jgi:hypothetical protein